jgi:uncharacterized protein DUF4232
MRRLLLAMMLVSCAAPASVSPTAPPTPTATRSVVSATPVATATLRSASTPEPTGLAKCSPSQLQVVAAGVLAADSFVGAVFIANRGTASCTLRGNPELVLLAKDGSRLEVKYAQVTAGTGAPALVVVPITQFREDPNGVAGIGASAPVQWTNYCDDVLPATFRITLPEAGGVIDGTFIDLAGKPITVFGAPRCDDASGPSTLLVYPFREPVQ